MRLAAIVNLFDGEELLEGALRQIRTHVDEIIVIWQDHSSSGEYHNVRPEVYRLKEIGLVDIAIQYEAKPEYIARTNELNKRRIGVKIAYTLECTHFLFLDCDEYYDEYEFGKAKEVTEEGNYDSIYCSIYTYYKQPIYQIAGTEGMVVPFICKLNHDTVIGTNDFGSHVSTYPFPCDPTRGLLIPGKTLHFSTDSIAMHHYSFIRKDIGLKLRNSSARNDFGHYRDSIENMIKTFEGFDYENQFILFYRPPHRVIRVKNKFGIHID